MDPFHGLSAREWREVVRRSARQYEQEHGYAAPESGIPETYLHQAAQEVRSRRLTWRSAPVLVGGWVLCAGVMVSLMSAASARYGFAPPAIEAHTLFACPMEDTDFLRCPNIDEEPTFATEVLPCPSADLAPPQSVPRLDGEGYSIQLLHSREPLAPLPPPEPPVVITSQPEVEDVTEPQEATPESTREPSVVFRFDQKGG